MSETCHAYNQKGQRCELYAGHEDDHQIVVAWTDEECWIPGAQQEVRLYPDLPTTLKTEAEAEVEQSLGPVPIYGEGKPGFCIMCSHAMHARECERNGCDCKSGIPG